MNISLERFILLKEEGLISLRNHPVYKDIFIANYSAKCQFDKLWTKETISCRGLVIDKTGKVLARPFPKFFNLAELKGLSGLLPSLYDVKFEDVFSTKFTAYEKLDGALIIGLHLPNGVFELTTRGSFESPQAAEARSLLQEKYNGVVFSPAYTYLFEGIFPSSKVVVSYAERDLYLLTIIETDTGRELSREDIAAFNLPFPRPKVFDNLSSIEEAEKDVDNYDNFEGFVFHFENGFRCKLKCLVYSRLHKIITGTWTDQRIIDVLRSGVNLDELYAGIPDEFYSEIRAKLLDKRRQYDILVEQVKTDFSLIKMLAVNGNRKSFAIKAAKLPHSAALFAMYDGKPFEDTLWKLL